MIRTCGSWIVAGLCSFAALAAATPSASSPVSVPTQARSSVEVVAIVAERVVTDRQVLLDLMIKRPEDYRPNQRVSDLPKSAFETAIQAYLLELMILEDNRLIGRESANENDLKRAFQSLQRRMGARYRAFLQDFELSEGDVRTRLSQHLVVDKILEARVALAGHEMSTRGGKAVSAGDREAAGRKALEEWMGQLRVRYPVQRLSTQKSEGAESPGTVTEERGP